MASAGDGTVDSGERFVTFSGGGVHGLVVAGVEPDAACAEAVRLLDPSSAVETVHWGRNYIYAASCECGEGLVDVVVKQFRNQGLRHRVDRRLRGSKAARSWRAATAIVDAGLLTPEPVMLVESDEAEGASLYVSRRLRDAFEVRQFFRRLNHDPSAEAFPDVEPLSMLTQLGELAQRLHGAGIWYRDLSMGNVLARRHASPAGERSMLELFLVDSNRARLGRRLGLVRRCRDICRFPILERAHRMAFLTGYWGSAPSRWSPRWWLYVASVRGYLLKHATKKRLRGVGKRRHATGGMHHAHIPAASEGVSARDRVVWDRLSDQPHQHAGKLQKLAIRFADSPSHVRDLAGVAMAVPQVWRRYRKLRSSLYLEPRPFSGIGVCVRPYPDDPEAHLELLSDLGVRSVMLRLHPWATDHRDELSLARELSSRGFELSFALPQNRDLVRDQGRWCEALEEIAETFSPFGCRFQVGQAVNRSKWGVWTRAEYIELFTLAAEILRRRPGVELLGPAVIDFEFQVTAAILNRRRRGLFFDAVSSLLYVDRRGAPEHPQLGFDTVGKVVLLRALAETGRNCTERCWITEVNWPLSEGPHSPAGRTVSVSEETQASYLARYFLLALGTGLVERVFWWRLVARGYGLVDPATDGGLRQRPSYRALRTLAAVVEGSTFLGPMPSAPGAWLCHFVTDSDEIVAGWSVDEGQVGTLPRPAARIFDRDGRELAVPEGTEVELGPAPVYIYLVPE